MDKGNSATYPKQFIPLSFLAPCQTLIWVGGFGWAEGNSVTASARLTFRKIPALSETMRLYLTGFWWIGTGLVLNLRKGSSIGMNSMQFSTIGRHATNSLLCASG